MATGKLALAGLAIAAACGLVVFAVVPSCESSRQELSVVPNVPAQTIEARIGDKTFHLECATNSTQRYQGLSDRKEIAKDGGMVFAFPWARHLSFVMRRCYVPIDILYLDDDGVVISMYQMKVIQPIGGDEWEDPDGGYASGAPARFAVEIRGGLLDELGVKVGDVVGLPLEELKRRAQ